MRTKPEQWKDSEAKRLLRKDIISGAVTASMKAKDVYKMRLEYQTWKYTNFRNNLKSLHNVIAASYARMQTDCKAYGHDRALLKSMADVQTQPNIPWHESAARKLLKQDVDASKHLQMRPMELHTTRPEFMAFALKVFRKHIYQEIENQAKRLSRFAKKKTRSQQLQNP